jgi:hypothetical protein
MLWYAVVMAGKKIHPSEPKIPDEVSQVTTEVEEEIMEQQIAKTMAPVTISIVDEVMGLQMALDSKKSLAIQSLLDARTDIEQKLISLGHGSVVQAPAKRRGRPPGSGKSAVATSAEAPTPKVRFCNICGIVGHDARAHRSQGDKKRKFTPQELAAAVGQA